MYSRQSVDAQKPSDTAIGVGPDGQFKTAAHKEYPPQFCDALAGTIIDQIQFCQRRGSCTEVAGDLEPDLLAWLTEAAVQCGKVRETATWLPDFQAR